LGNKDTVFDTNAMVFESNGKLIDFKSPRVMGILNVTPDSFYDGGKFDKPQHWNERCRQMLEQGAYIIDIGAFSSRPGARMISLEEEKLRLIPAVKVLAREFPDTIISVDTYRSEIARICVEEGASIINDISGGNFDNEMFETIARLDIAYVLMHMQGKPEDMQHKPIQNNALTLVKKSFETKVRQLQQLGHEKIILDPGYGFGKSLECSFQLLNHQDELRINGLPILAGLSRKSLVNKILGTSPKEALNGTTALNMLALTKGANVLRVHDVKEAGEAIRLFEFYKKADCH